MGASWNQVLVVVVALKEDYNQQKAVCRCASIGLCTAPYMGILTAVIWYESDCEPYHKPKPRQSTVQHGRSHQQDDILLDNWKC